MENIYNDNNIIHCVWSFDDDINPTDIAYHGKCVVYQLKDDYFSKNGFISSLLTNPTYIDLFIVAEQQITTTMDFHHIFLEGFTIIKHINLDIIELSLDLGS